MNHISVLGFTGAYLDPVIDGDPLGEGYRWYIHRLMRFNAADDMSPFNAGGPNPYAYCAGDPINYDDPTGHMEVDLQASIAESLEETSNQVAPRLGRAMSNAPVADVPIAVRRGTQALELDMGQPGTSAAAYHPPLQSPTLSLRVGPRARLSRFFHEIPDYYHLMKAGEKMDEINGKLERNVSRNIDLNHQEPHALGMAIHKVFAKKEKIRVLIEKLDSYISTNQTDRQASNWSLYSERYRNLLEEFEKHNRSVENMLASIKNLLNSRFTHLRRPIDEDPS